METQIISDSANRIYSDSIVIDMCENIYSMKDPDYFETLANAGVTAVGATIPDDWDGLEAAITRTAEFYRHIEGSKKVRIAFAAADIEKAKVEGKVAIVMGAQNPLPVERNLDIVKIFHILGFRVMQLAYLQQNYLGAGCIERVDHGLTDFGRDAVRELNKSRILIDVSHCGDKTSIDAARASKYPIVATHSTPGGLVDLVRARSDDAIKAIAESGGVVGVMVMSPFCEKRDKMGERPTISDLVDLIDYIVDLVGIDHVGLGTDLLPDWEKQDYDSVMKSHAALFLPHKPARYEERWIEGFDEVADIVKIVTELLMHGYRENEARKILGGNWLRVIKDVCG